MGCSLCTEATLGWPKIVGDGRCLVFANCTKKGPRAGRLARHVGLWLLAEKGAECQQSTRQSWHSNRRAPRKGRAPAETCTPTCKKKVHKALEQRPNSSISTTLPTPLHFCPSSAGERVFGANLFHCAALLLPRLHDGPQRKSQYDSRAWQISFGYSVRARPPHSDPCRSLEVPEISFAYAGVRGKKPSSTSSILSLARQERAAV